MLKLYVKDTLYASTKKSTFKHLTYVDFLEIAFLNSHAFTHTLIEITLVLADFPIYLLKAFLFVTLPTQWRAEG